MNILDLVLHLDKHLANVVNLYGTYTYFILFLILFAETGLVVTPFLPGDSLLFVVGTLSGGGILNIWIIYPLFMIAVFLGDNTNYWIGRRLGPKVFSKEKSRILNKEYLDKTHKFFEKYGKKTIILARFVPIVRTFAPFVAGVAKMPYLTFLAYSIGGSLLWVSLLTLAGYFFGGLPFIKKNFEFAVLAVIFISLLPMVFEFIKAKRAPALSKEELKEANLKKFKKTIKK